MNLRLASLVAVAALALLGCTSSVSVTLPIHARVGAEPFSCTGTFAGLGSTATHYRPTDLRFYVHDVRLLTEDGEVVDLALTDDGHWQRDGVALIDLEDRTGTCANGTVETNDRLVGTAPEGHYHGVRLTVGLPLAANHQDALAAQPPLDVAGLFWGWEPGYRFVRIDGKTDGLPNGHNLHLGSTACHADAPNHVTGCDQENTFEVEVTDLELDRDALVLDLATLFAGSNLDVNAASTAPGCMSEPGDPDCAPIFQRFGLPFGATAANPSAQVFLRKE